jgi:hypothetical protein
MKGEKPTIRTDEEKPYRAGRYRVNRGQPGHDVITEFREGRPILNSTFVDLTKCNFNQGKKAQRRGV